MRPKIMTTRGLIALIAVVFGFILVAGFAYGIAVGRYHYPPYRQVSPIYQRFSDVRQSLSYRAPRYSEEAIKIEEEALRAKDQRLELVDQVSDSVTDLVIAAYKSYEVTLDSPIGYTIGHSVESGDAVSVYVHNAEATSVEVHRLGRMKEQVESLAVLPEKLQDPLFSSYKGFDWEPSFTLSTQGYRSGYYLIELTGLDTGNRYQIPLIVTPVQPPRIAFVAQTNTWHAYNSFGGLAFYTDTRHRIATDPDVRDFNLALKNQLRHQVHLPYARPYTYALGNPDIPIEVTRQPPLDIRGDTRPEDPFDGHLFRSEWTLIAFAEEHGLDYGVYTDSEFDPESPILESKLIVFNTHTEYWSQDMVEALSLYLAQGGKVIFAGGNTMYRKIKHTEYGMRVPQHEIPSYVASPYLGTSYTGDGFRTYGSYQVVNADHWIFDGSGVEDNDEIGAYSANHPAPGSLGEGGLGASGFETDKVNRYSELYSDGFQNLAVGTNKQGPAHMVFKETDASGWVFNAASISFAGAMFHDPVIDRMMLNLMLDE